MADESLLELTEIYLRNELASLTLDTEVSRTEKMKIIDRVLKLESIKAKMDADPPGSFFDAEE